MTATRKPQKNQARPGQPKNQGAEPAEVLTLAEAAAYLRLTEEAVLRLIEEQGLPARRLGDEWRFLKTAMQRWLSHELAETGKAAQLALAGSWKDDPLVNEELKETYRNRDRSVV